MVNSLEARKEAEDKLKAKEAEAELATFKAGVEKARDDSRITPADAEMYIKLGEDLPEEKRKAILEELYRWNQAVGQEARYIADGLAVPVIIRGATLSYGRVDVLIQPVGGEGERFVNASKLELAGEEE